MSVADEFAKHLRRLKHASRACMALCIWAYSAAAPLAMAQTPPSSSPDHLTVLSPSGEVQPVRAQVWIDVSGSATVTDIEAMSNSAQPLALQTYQQGTTVLKPGQAAWVRIHLQSTSTTARWVLQAQHPAYENITLYAKNGDGSWQSQTAGVAIPRSDWPHASRLPRFEIKHLSDRLPTRLWVKLAHTATPYYTPLIVAQEHVLLSEQQRETLWLGLAFGIMLASLCLSLTQAQMLKDQAYFLHAIYAGLYLAFAACHLGIVQRFFLPDLTAPAYALSRALPTFTMAAALWFAFEVLDNKASRMLFQTSRVMVFILIFFGISELFSWHFFSLADSYLLILFSAFCALVMILNAIFRGRKSSRLFGWALVPILVCILPPIVHYLGWADVAALTQYPLALGPVLEIPLLHYALMVRSDQRREGLARVSGLSNKDALTGLTLTRSWLDNLTGCMARAERFRHAYGLMYVDIVNHDWFFREFGSETTDRVILLVASHLQRHFSEVDCICRVSESQFVIAIEGATNIRQLSQSCARILAATKTADPLLPVGSAPKLHLTCALMPKARPENDQADAQTILAWLIESSDAPRETPNQAVRTLGF